MTSSRPTASKSRSTPRPEPAAGQQGRTAYFVRSMDWRRTGALAPIAAKASSEFARLEAIPPDDSEILGGPSGIRTQDRRIKSQWLQLQNSLKTASKNRETAGKQLKPAGKRQVSGHLPDTKWRQWRHLKKGGNAGLRPKEHTCATIATVRALTDEGLPTAHGGTGVSRV